MADPTEPTPIFHGVIEGHPDTVLPDGSWLYAPETPAPDGPIDLTDWEPLGHTDEKDNSQ